MRVCWSSCTRPNNDPRYDVLRPVTRASIRSDKTSNTYPAVEKQTVEPMASDQNQGQVFKSLIL